MKNKTVDRGMQDKGERVKKGEKENNEVVAESVPL